MMVEMKAAQMVVRRVCKKAESRVVLMADLWDPMMVDSKAERLAETMAV